MQHCIISIFITFIFMTGFGKTHHLRIKINIEKYVIQLFKVQYLEQAQSCKLTICYHLVYSQLFNSYKATHSKMHSQLNFPLLLQISLYQDHKDLYRVMGGGQWVALKWQVTAKLNNFQDEICLPLDLKCLKIQLHPWPTP